MNPCVCCGAPASKRAVYVHAVSGVVDGSRTYSVCSACSQSADRLADSMRARFFREQAAEALLCAAPSGAMLN